MLTLQINGGITIYSALEWQTFTFNSCVDRKTCKNREGKNNGRMCLLLSGLKKKNYALRLLRFSLRSVLV